MNERIPESSELQEQIRELRAENVATHLANTGLQEAARNDKLEIAELREAQLRIEQLNDDLNSRNVALEALNKELESFSYAVSHDLRSPLRAIHGFSEALKASAESRLTVQELTWLQKVLDAASRMDRLTEDLLRLSRIARSQLKREPVDLSRMAREIVNELRGADAGRDVAVAIDDGMVVSADPVLMRVVVGNLIENAWKYTGRKEHAVISFTRVREADQDGFCLRDNGAGFDMQYSAKLFTPFQRLHSAREFPGSGVGLACVARVVHKHAGTIRAEAKTGQGAAFFFTIPEDAQVGNDGE